MKNITARKFSESKWMGRTFHNYVVKFTDGTLIKCCVTVQDTRVFVGAKKSAAEGKALILAAAAAPMARHADTAAFTVAYDGTVQYTNVYGKLVQE